MKKILLVSALLTLSIVVKAENRPTSDFAVSKSSSDWLVQLQNIDPIWNGPNNAKSLKKSEATQAVQNFQGKSITQDNAIAPYCGPLQFANVEPITLVQFADINKTSSATTTGGTAHEDFTTTQGNVSAGGSYLITLKGNTGGNYQNEFVVFFDWNNNGVLNDPGEVYVITQKLINSTGVDNVSVSQTIAVPTNATSGSTRMRVKKVLSVTDLLNPCLGTSYGQAEDYKINVTSLAPYCGPLNFPTNVEPITLVQFAGIDKASAATLGGTSHENFITTQGNVVAGGSYQINLKGNTGGNVTNRFVVFFDWNNNGVLNDAGEVYEITETITNSTGVDTKTATHTILVPANATVGPKRMRVKKILGTANYLNPCFGAPYGQAEDYTVNVSSLAPYCGPLPFIGREPITSVKFAGIVNASSNATTSPAHENFTYKIGNVSKGSSHMITLKGNTVGDFTNAFVVFIDWNQNGVFTDAGEVYPITQMLINSTGIDNKEVTQMLAVPGNALTGMTRMRIKKVLASVNTTTNPCAGEMYGQAEDYSINVISLAPYCGPLEFSTAVEPITKVTFAGINNTSSANTEGVAPHEDFTAKVGTVARGSSHSITLKGNTVGYETNRFVVFIDWNNNGVLDDAGEVYQITQLLINSTGNDNKEVTQVLAVPANAVIGNTRMRIKKIFGNTNYTNPCLGASYGQAEDYTITVTAALDMADFNKVQIQVYPNPATDVLNIVSSTIVNTVQVFDITGKLVGSHIVNAAESTVNISNLAPGMYLITIQTDEGSQSKKVVKK